MRMPSPSRMLNQPNFVTVLLCVCITMSRALNTDFSASAQEMKKTGSTVASSTPLRAVVVGGTGATGRQVVRTLLERNWHVTVVSRRSYEHVQEPPPSSFTQIISSLSTEDMPTLTTSLKAHDALFNCLGTTRGSAGSAEAFVAVEVGMTETVSDVAFEAGIPHVSVVSAEGANKDMWVPTTLIHPLLYMRTLGEKEGATLSHPFKSVSIFRPGMLNRLSGDRGWENLVNRFLPALGLRVDTLALAMVLDAEEQVAVNMGATGSGGTSTCTVGSGDSECSSGDEKNLKNTAETAMQRNTETDIDTTTFDNDAGIEAETRVKYVVGNHAIRASATTISSVV